MAREEELPNLNAKVDLKGGEGFNPTVLISHLWENGKPPVGSTWHLHANVCHYNEQTCDFSSISVSEGEILSAVIM